MAQGIGNGHYCDWDGTDSEGSQEAGYAVELESSGGSGRSREKRDARGKRLPKAVELFQEISQVVDKTLPCSISDIETTLAENSRTDLSVHKDFERIASKIIDAKKIQSIKSNWEDIMTLVPETHFPAHEYLTREESSYWFFEILKFNSISPLDFIQNVYDVMNRRKPKKNAVFLKGEPNAGKSLIANSIGRSAVFYSSCQSFNGNSSFEFAGMLFQRCALVNECKLTDKTVETMKCIAEGLPVQIDVKFKGQQLLRRTPLVITGNQELFFYTTKRNVNEKAFNARCHVYDLKSMNQLANCSQDLHPLMWLDILKEFKIILSE